MNKFLTFFCKKILNRPFAFNQQVYWPDWYRSMPDQVKREALLRHELTHLEQQEKVGNWKFLFLYLLSFPVLYNVNRRDWEFEAFRVELEYLFANKEGVIIDRQYYVELLSGKAYGYMCSRKTAEKWIESLNIFR